MKKQFNGHDEKGGIYKITNSKTGMVYIGSTSCFRRRAKQHELHLKKGIHGSKKLQTAFNECGEDAFSFEVVEVMPEANGKQILKREEEILQDYRQRGETESLYNVDFFPLKDNHSCFFNVSEETVKNKAKPVLQFSLDGKLLRKWGSMRTAAKAFNLEGSSAISACAKGKIKSVGGYSWKFESKNDCIKVRKKILQYSLDGLLIKKWDSEEKASKSLNISKIAIRNCAKGLTKSCGGFIWKYEQSSPEDNE